MSRWSDDEVEFLVKNYDSMSAREIAERLGKSVGSVKAMASELGLSKRSGSIERRASLIMSVVRGFGGVYVGSMSEFVGICRLCGVRNVAKVLKFLRDRKELNYARLIVRRKAGKTRGAYKVFGDLVGKLVVWTDSEALIKTLNDRLNYCMSDRERRKLLTYHLRNIFTSDVVDGLKKLCRSAS